MISKLKNFVKFGFKKVKKNKKKSMINNIFNSVADKYDLMNDIMSLGIHRIWKKISVFYSCTKSGSKILDIAGGTGDLTIEFSKIIGKNGKIILLDINNKMLEIARKKIRNKGLLDNIYYVQADAEKLPFMNNYFDCINISFGFRNFTNQKKALSSIFRVLKPGGCVLLLEFSHLNIRFLNNFYKFYCLNILPFLGFIIVKDYQSYRYLGESIQVHPNQKKLKKIMKKIGFQDVNYFNFTGGIVALHRGFKY